MRARPRCQCSVRTARTLTAVSCFVTCSFEPVKKLTSQAYRESARDVDADHVCDAVGTPKMG